MNSETRSYPPYQHWIDTLAASDGRLYYRDQTPAALAWLADTVRTVAPTRIVELGTLAGLSLRCSIEASRPFQTAITAVDMSFRVLHEKAAILPLDLSRVTLLEHDILKLDFAGLWGPSDRVVLYVDAHDQPGVPIMDHVLRQALPLLPAGSAVIVDDLWYSPEPLTTESAPAFFSGHVRDAVDPLQCFTGHFAPYHGGGSFMGFAETPVLLRYANAAGIPLQFQPAIKSVTITCPPQTGSPVPAGLDAADLTGAVVYNPLDAGPQATSDAVYAADHFRAGRIDDAFALLASHPEQGLGRYGMAVCQARQGHPRQALECLDQEMERDIPHPRAAELSHDLTDFLDRRDGLPQVTIFAMPKAFAGHTGMIQRNALQSWTRLSPRPRVLLLGDDPGTAEIAAELGFDHIPDVPRNASGTPLVNGLFETAARHAPNDILAYVNADIILFDDFMAAVAAVRRRHDAFLVVGRRHDMTLDHPIDFNTPDWNGTLRRELDASGILHAECGLDYFIHTPGIWGAIPPFGLGRTVWDLWLLAAPLSRGATVIDASEAVTIIHQAHDYRHLQNGLHEAYLGAEAAANQDLGRATGVNWDISCRAIPRKLTPNGRIVPQEITQPRYMSEAFGNERRQWLESAITQQLQADKPELALIHLEELALRFPGDADIASRIKALKQRISQAESSL